MTLFSFIQTNYLQIFSQSLRHGTNACSTNSTTGVCPFLCMGRPNNGHSCICPDGMHVELQSNGSEKCLCPNGQVPQANGSCPLGTFCLFILYYFVDPFHRNVICLLVSVNQTCPEDYFECQTPETCIPFLWRCDGDNDCYDKSDEVDRHFIVVVHCCNHFICSKSKVNCTSPSCSTAQFQCGNGRCIPLHWRCDFDNDCDDSSDETHCGK